jgi:DNA-binding transcriptional regulator YiaG
MGKPCPWMCGSCRKREVWPVILPTYEAALCHDGDPHEIRLENFHVFRCEACGTIILDDIANDRITDAIRKAAGILPPRLIRYYRDRSRLSSPELAGMLDVPIATLNRWECGDQLQSKAEDADLRRWIAVEFGEAPDAL